MRHIGSGKRLEALVRSSAQRQGLRLTQTGPRAVSTGKRDLQGRPISVHVESGQLDFVGHHKGRHCTFDAKSTKGKSLPLRNIKRNQATICRRAHDDGAIAFFLVEFADLQVPEYFALQWPVLAEYWPNLTTGNDPQSIPLAVFRERCPRVTRDRHGLDLVGLLEQLMEARP